jgi:2-keto-3-deoxy-L-rhamnonate aldolase RhmA
MIGTFTLNSCIQTTKILSKHLDFVIIDREHGLHSFEDVKCLLNASEKKCLKLVRASNLNKIEIQRTLETNPDGILIPQISSFSDAKKAVEYSFFSPIGNRGVSPYTETFNFHHSNSIKKMKDANKNLFLGLLIEGIKGINAIDQIAKELKDRISLIYFGLYDFSASQKLDPSWTNKKIISAAKKIINTCKKNKIQVGSIARSKKEIFLLKKYGFQLIVYQNDTGIFSEALANISKK